MYAHLEVTTPAIHLPDPASNNMSPSATPHAPRDPVLPHALNLPLFDKLRGLPISSQGILKAYGDRDR